MIAINVSGTVVAKEKTTVWNWDRTKSLRESARKPLGAVRYDA